MTAAGRSYDMQIYQQYAEGDGSIEYAQVTLGFIPPRGRSTASSPGNKPEGDVVGLNVTTSITSQPKFDTIKRSKTGLADSS